MSQRTQVPGPQVYIYRTDDGAAGHTPHLLALHVACARGPRCVPVPRVFRPTRSALPAGLVSYLFLAPGAWSVTGVDRYVVRTARCLCVSVPLAVVCL